MSEHEKCAAVESLVKMVGEFVTAGLRDTSPAVQQSVVQGFATGKYRPRVVLDLDNLGRLAVRFHVIDRDGKEHEVWSVHDDTPHPFLGGEIAQPQQAN